MGIRIDMSNAKIDGKARVLNNAELRGGVDAAVEMHGIEVMGNAVVLDNMNLDPFMEELQHTADTMGTDDFEYRSIK